MKLKRLLVGIASLLLVQMADAQTMKPADAALQQRLQKYVADNHLPAAGTYMYWDSAAKKPIRFQAGTFLTEDASAPPSAAAPQAAKGSTNSLLGGTGNFHLVKDINTIHDSYPSNYQDASYSPVQQYAVLNKVAYFTADDGIHGVELWRSDGTAAGTYLFKDITNGVSGTHIYSLYASSTLLYFSLYNSNTLSWQVFATDGIGSNLISLFPAANSLSAPAGNFCDVNGTLYFTNSYYGNDSKLWKTDGTLAGTSVVKDFSGANLQGLFDLTAVNGLLYFSSTSYTANGIQGQLYRSNGTDTGTHLVKAFTSTFFSYIYPPSQLTAYNNLLYFVTDDGTGFSTLWVSDGTEAGTTYVPGYNGVSIYNYGNYYYQAPSPLVISNNVLYFSGYTYATGWELYKYDAASNDGITLVKDITPGTGGNIINSYNMTELNGAVYFAYTDAGGLYHLYKTNGTDATTTAIKDFATGNAISNFYNAGGKLYFVESELNTNAEPWTSDGTTVGTVRLADIYPGSGGSSPAYFTPVNGKVLFTAADNVHGSELFVSNGSTAQLVKDINTTTTSGSGPYNMVAFGDGVLAGAYTYDKGYELYKASPSDESLVQEIVPGQPGSYPQYFTVKNNVTYFSANSSNAYGIFSIYKTDGTAGGTVKLTTDIPGYIYGLTVTDNGNVFYFIYNNQVSQYQLWKTDGTDAGTLLLGNFNSFYYYYYGDNTRLVPIGNTIYFSASTTSTGTEVFKSDGTVEGTVIVKDIYPGASSSYPAYLSAFNNQLFFAASDGTETALWKSDGTSGGTTKLASVQPANLTVSGNSLFFSGYNSISGNELWKTDGNVEGTVLVKDVLPGTYSSIPLNLTDVDGTLFFTANDSAYNVRLWKSNGTSAGTQLIASLAGTYPYNFVSSAGKLFFTANNKLWGSDGTSGGTGAISDDVVSGLSVYGIVANGSKLFLNAYTYQYGTELYEGDASLVALPVSLVSFTAALRNADVVAQWQTSSETNTSYFTVQRSTDGIHFTDIAKVNAKGNSNALQTYSFPDVNIANLVSVNTIYYRLQIADKDGSTSLSKTVPVNVNLKDAVVLLLPNPVKDVLTIRVNNYTGKAAISIFDANGRNVYSKQQAMESGSDIRISTSALQSGVYLVKVNLVQQKFIKE